jgi:hypothetical protein
MNVKLDNYLVEKYPKIFINRYGNMKDTLMYFGFEHGDGWFFILDQLCYSIQSYIENNNLYRDYDKKISQVVATQVKEKFGTLSFYYNGGDDYIDGMIHLAEVMSSNTCEYCGTTENVGRTKGWISTVCKDCHDKNPRISDLAWEENESNPTSDVLIELRKIKLDKLNLNKED